MNKIVIGLGFGDEGKGSVVDYLCSKNPDSLVIRFCGGPQAGHTVYYEDKNHVFSNFGSGTFRNVPTYWNCSCLVDPIGLDNEYEILAFKSPPPIIYINEDCPIITPLDMTANQINESQLHHGSCGIGIGQTRQRNEDGCYLKFKDLYNPKILRLKYQAIKEYYRFDNRIDIFKQYDKDFFKHVEYITKNKNIIKGHPEPPYKHDTYIYEGSQGLLLSENIGFFPHSTKGHVDTTNITINETYDDLYLVTRAYQTRHGNGPMTNEEIPHNIQDNPYESNKKNDWQGEFRCSLLDLDLLEYAINSDGQIKHCENKTLVITCLDLIKNEYRFTYKDKIICCNDETDFIEKIADILKIKEVLTNNSPFSSTFVLSNKYYEI